MTQKRRTKANREATLAARGIVERPSPPLCQFCGKEALLFKQPAPRFECGGCSAGVAASPKTGKPAGLLMKSRIGQKRDAAKVAFQRLALDKVFRDGIGETEARRAGCAWLAKQLNLNVANIDDLDEQQCDQVVAICTPLWSVNRRASAGRNGGKAN